MEKVNVNHKLKRIEVSNFEIENDIVFNYFNNLPSSERGSKLIRAIYIGVLAMMEDRISSFLSKTSNELGTELESLKMIFEMKSELFYKSAVKGLLAEEDIADFLTDYFQNKNLKDKASLTGNTTGLINKNKTGDIICEVNGDSQTKIVIECKFDKSLKLGDIISKDVFTKKSDTAWSQLLEAKANRDAKVGIIVLDVSLVDNSILKQYENVGYIPEVGFIAIVDSQKGDYSNLIIAYMLARDIAIKSFEVKFDKHLLRILIGRIIKDLNDIINIKNLVLTNIENNKAILRQLEKSTLSMQFNQEYFDKFLEEGTLDKKDLLSFYSGEEIKDKYKLIEKDIENI